MAWKWLSPINIIAVLAILFIAVFTWMYLPREQFLWAAYFIVVILLLTLYANVRQPILDYIEARRKAKNKPVDVESEKRLRILNYIAIFAMFMIAIFSWVAIPREQFTWSMMAIALILVLMGLINIRQIFRDIS